MKKAVVVLGFAAGFCLAAAAHDNLTVGVDETLTISTNAFYNSITVNGTLNVDNGAVVKVEDASGGGGAVYVGSGAGVTGTLNVTAGANVTANNNSGSKVYIGHNGGTGVLNVDNANFYTYNMHLGNDNAKSTARVTLRNSAVAYAQNSILFGGYHQSSDATSAVVRVESDARLKTWQFAVSGDVPACVYFRGGLIECWAIYNQYSGNFVLDGTAEYPIRTQFNSASKGDGTYYFTYFLTSDGYSGKIVFQGDCDWIKEGTGAADQELIPYSHRTELSMKYTGRTIVRKGGFALRGENLLPKTSELVLERGTCVSWGGNWQELRAVSGQGKIRSNGVSDRLTLNVPAGTTSRLSCAIDNLISVVKTGEGTLEVLEDDFANVTVNAGRLKVLNRAEFGYDTYRFKIDSAYSPEYDAVHLSELYFYNGDERVSTPYLSTTHSKLFDENYDNDHKWWITANYATDTETSFNDRHATVSYSETKKLTSYSWVTAGDSPGSWQKGRDPGSWRLLGSMAGASGMKTLSTVGHREYLKEVRHAETEKFPVVYPRPACSNLTVSTGGTLELADGVELACRGVMGVGGDIVCGTGARIVSVVEDDQTLAYPVFDGGAFEKAGAGTTRVTGDLAGLGVLRVSGGTLAVDNGYAVTNRYFRFVIASNRWMAAHAGTEPSTTEQKTVQFGELALYDRRGNRINLSTNGATSSGTASAGYLLDDKTTTSCYYTGLPAAYDFTVTISEANAAAGVVSYLFAQETQYYGVADKTPASWKVYTKETDGGTWTLVDDRPDCRTENGGGWKGWNGGTPWQFGTKSSAPRAALDATTDVAVASNAVLDVSATGAATQFGSLTVDMADAGTIRGGAFAATGVLSITNFALEGGKTLPLVFVGTTAPASFANWTVVVNGEVKPNVGISFDGTHLTLLSPSTVILFR